ncbi:hypothetical protein QOZ80_1BG0082200 [Eleusine coracana subsp. coracana]|nr:hypothetical protein QOZ80_1BG0082200 [Eleusine coracana subsp. coracana]
MALDSGRRALPRDCLSDLPDAILVSVLSLLRLDEAARCTILASRWRRLFTSTLLDFNTYMPDRRDVVEAVNSILAAHPTAPIRSFRTSGSFQDGWIEDLARRGVQQLSLGFGLDFWWNDDERLRIPASLFACTSLTHLSARSCIFPDASMTAAGAPHLACLTEVNLFDVTICDESLNSLISQCKALERLEMMGISNCGRVRVRSPSLKFLNCDGYIDELFIEHAPNLEWLHGRYMYMKGRLDEGVYLKVEHAPKLEFIGYISMSLHAIKIGESILSEERICVKTLMPSMKMLAVNVCYTRKGYINWIIQLLKIFPCLETLHIRSDAWSCIQAAAQESWDVLTCIPCVDNHLQKVIFEVYRGHEWQREMAKFLHGRSMFLKAMEFHCMEETSAPGDRPFKVPSEEWVREQKELLGLDSRASKDARFLFFKHQLACNHLDFAHNNERHNKGQYDNDLFDV